MARSSDEPLIIVLGAPNDAAGRLLPVALTRVAEAVAVHRDLPDSQILPTGGWGSHFNESRSPHHQLVTEALVAGGVDRQQVLPGVSSANTSEDASGACQRARQLGCGRLLVVTSDFHAERAEILFERSCGTDLVVDFRLAPSGNLDRALLDDLRNHEQSALVRLRRGHRFGET